MSSALGRSATSHIVVMAAEAPAASSARLKPSTPSPRTILPRSVSEADNVTSVTSRRSTT